jgi:alpha/beta superfamily hydrolase
LHGITVDKNEWLDFYITLSGLLAEKNIATLRIDFRGHGASALKPHDFTISSQIQDAVSAMKWLKEKQFPKLSVFGTSFGALPAIQTANIFKEDIQSLFLLVPVLSYMDTFIEPVSEWGKETFYDLIDRSLVKGEKVFLTDDFFITPALVSEMLSITIFDAIAKTSLPVHVMHGDQDNMVDWNTSIKAAQEFDSVTLHSSPNMDHGFTNKGDDVGNHPVTLKNIARIMDIISTNF